MCGIGGIVRFNNQPVDTSDLEVLSSFMTKRGPDYQSNIIKENIGFVHTRLSIIDLDPRSHQPMQDDKGNVITFNGEIYNFLDLKKELQNNGITFSTQSDTEVLLKGFSFWGIDTLLQKVNGMFAFTIYEPATQKVYLCRDFFGKKPLYYFANENEVIFSSDIRGIWSLKKKDLSLDYQSIRYYLSELAVPQPKTIWKEIQQIPPAHYLTLDLNQKETQLTEFWKLSDSKNKDIDLQTAVNLSEEKIVEAIKRRTISDVPLGCFLSGGVDSGLIVSLLAQNTPTPINTFTIGVENSTLNEVDEAAIVAERYQTNHSVFYVKPNMLEDLESILYEYGEPFADSSAIATYYVTKAIRSDATVALSGDGGDELFGGYNDYGIAFRSDQFAQQFPNPFIRSVVTKFDQVKSKLVPKKENFGAYNEYIHSPHYQKLYRQMGFSPSLSKEKLIHNELKNNSTFTQEWLNQTWNDNTYQGDTLTDTLLRASLKTRLLNDYLVKVDRASMMNSLEVRSPLLDKELAEWSFSLPSEIKFHNNINKFILKEIAKKHVDPNILNRPKKGFSIPIEDWLCNELANWMKEILLDGFAKRNIFSSAYISQLIEEHQAQKKHTHRLWSMICLELWMKKFVD